MTIIEAVQAGIARIRKPTWNDAAYLKLYITSQDDKFYHGPWVYLYDKNSKLGSTEPDTIFFAEADDGANDWEVYKGEVYDGKDMS